MITKEKLLQLDAIGALKGARVKWVNYQHVVFRCAMLGDVFEISEVRYDRSERVSPNIYLIALHALVGRKAQNQWLRLEEFVTCLNGGSLELL